jgi:hypothetical protein
MCQNNNLTELPELPNSLLLLHCSHNKLTELPELPISLEHLWCNKTDIKYLSPNNCQVIKKCSKIHILNNPLSSGFTSDKDFREYLNL